MEYTVSNHDTVFNLDASEIERLDAIQISENEFHLLEDGCSYNCKILSIDTDKKLVRLEVNNELFELKINTPLDKLIKEMGMNSSQSNTQKEIKAPMPGLILDILVEVGQTVEKDDGLVILEAMKMENILKAEGKAVIKEIKMSKGDSVEKHQVLIELE